MRINWLKVWAVSVLIFLIINTVVIMKLLHEIQGFRTVLQQENNLPCKAIPARFALDNPDCANSFQQAMGVENVRVTLPNGKTNHKTQEIIIS